MSFLGPIRASNALITRANLPKTCVFVGGTDGIGKASLRSLVSQGSALKVYIVGRNEAAHRPLINELSQLNPHAAFKYVEGQISLVADSQRLADQIAAKEDNIDLLFLSAGYLPFTGQTSEGLETSQVVSYYSHIVFITRLLSKIRAAAANKTGTTRIINILAAGQESTNIFLDDLTLKEPGRFNIPSFAAHAATTVTLSLKRIAEEAENKDIVFIHAHPGIVSTDLVKKSWGEKGVSQGAAGPAGAFAVSTPEESGERSLYLMTSAEYGGKGVDVPNGRELGQTLTHSTGGSVFSVSSKMEIIQQDDLLADLEKMGASQTIWDHTVEALNSRYV
ncbi:putative oxidoreductase [Ilyonectria robusta]